MAQIKRLSWRKIKAPIVSTSLEITHITLQAQRD